MNYALEAVAWAAAGIAAIVALIAIPDLVLRRIKARERHQAERARRRIKRRAARETEER